MIFIIETICVLVTSLTDFFGSEYSVVSNEVYTKYILASWV